MLCKADAAVPTTFIDSDMPAWHQNNLSAVASARVAPKSRASVEAQVIRTLVERTAATTWPCKTETSSLAV
jgi:hypothetical protein